MSAPTDYILDELNSITECCICFERYKDPRTLPCIHTFCLQCIQHVAPQKLPGDRIRCPLCNQKFTIPDDGLASLPGNPFVSRILELSNSAIVPGSDRQFDQESCERRKLKRNAEIVSRLLTDGIRCTQVREKAVTNVLAKHEIVKKAIIKKIDTLNLLLDDLQTQKQRKMDELEDEMDEMDNHLTTLASYKNYCVDLAEKGTASDVTNELAVLDKRLQELEEQHESRISRELDIHQKLLAGMLLDSVLNSGLIDAMAGNVQDLLRHNNSSEPQSGGTEEPNRKRMRLEDSNTGGGGGSFTFEFQINDNLGSSQASQQAQDGCNTNGSSSSSVPQQQRAAYSDTSTLFSQNTGSAGTAPGVSAPPATASDPSAAALDSSAALDFSTAMDSSTVLDSSAATLDSSTDFNSITESDLWTISEDLDL